MSEGHDGGWRLYSDTTGGNTDTVTVRKTCLGYRLSLPLGHTLSLSAHELLCISGWYLQHITELEQEAKEDEKREAEILEGRDFHLSE